MGSTGELSNYEEREGAAIDASKREVDERFYSHHMLGGLFAAVMDYSPGPDEVPLLAVDGGGTKVIVAQWMNRYDTIGIDALAMSMNDLAVFGKFNAVFACPYEPVQERIETEHRLAELNRGLNEGMRKCVYEGLVLNVGKFETASVDEILSGPRPGYAFDLATFAVGFMERKRIPSFSPEPGDMIIGFRSSGLHCNGYTAARHMLLSPDVEPREEWKSQYAEGANFTLDDWLAGSTKTIGDALLAPTELYFRDMQRIAEEIHGVFGINITGNGLRNFNRVKSNDIAMVIDSPFEPDPLHTLLVDVAGYDTKTAYTKFNMGMGFAVFVKTEEQARLVYRVAASEGHSAQKVGYVEEGSQEHPVTLLKKGGEVTQFTGY